MKLERVHLRNYRCFDDFLLEVGGGSLLVIGPNAGGKTSLVTAIRRALNGGGIDARDLRDRGAPAELIATVSGIPAAAQGDFADAVDITTNPPTVRVGLRASWNSEEERLDVVHGFPDVGWRPVRRAAREHLPVLWLPAWRDARRLAAMVGRESLLQELVGDLDLGQPLQDAITAITSASDTLAQAQPLQDLLGELRDELARLMPRVDPSAFALGVDIAQPEDILGQLALMVSHLGPQMPIPTHSGGVAQAAILVLALRLLDVNPGALLLVDEPELALHAQAQRAVVRALRDTARQSILTTHTAAILDRVDPTDVTRLRRSATGDTEAVRATGLTLAQARKLTRYATSLSAEAYFAETVLLVEGFSDLLAVRVLAAKLGVDLDAAGVSVISLEGGDVFPHYVALLGPQGLKVELRGLCDADKAQRWITHLRQAGLPVTDRPSMAAAGFYVCDPDLEEELVAPLTTAEIEAVFSADGALGDFQVFGAQPQYAGMTATQLQVAFTKVDKIRWAPLLADALTPGGIPQPIRDLLANV